MPNHPSFLFRSSKHQAFSIEEIFHALNKEINSNSAVKAIEVPYPSNCNQNILRNIRYARKLKQQFVHVTGDVHYVVPFLRAKKIVLTVHDAVLLSRYAKTNPKYWILKWFWYSLPVRFADVITVISEKTRSELICLTGVNPQKVHIVPNFVKPIFNSSKQIFNTVNPTVLLVGGGPHKNTIRAIEATAAINGCRISLLGVFETTVFQKLEALNISFEHHQSLTHLEVADLYKKCDLVLFPSLYEGFGMPIIEGQASGRPVITSNIAPMCDVAGAGACLVDPNSIDSIKVGLEKVIQDATYRDEIIEKGYENVRRFDLSTIAKMYMKVYSTIEKSEIALFNILSPFVMANFDLLVVGF